eukprot:1195930-Prorocentrum_minimum.AAC.4
MAPNDTLAWACRAESGCTTDADTHTRCQVSSDAQTKLTVTCLHQWQKGRQLRDAHDDLHPPRPPAAGGTFWR